MSASLNFPRLIRTLKPLHRRQLIDQVWNRARMRWEDPSRIYREIAEDGELPRVRANMRTRGLHPDPDAISDADIRAGRLRFIGIEHAVGCPPDWTSAEVPKLWRYNLHYHGFLFGAQFDVARECCEDYLNRAPAQRGAEGWEPYPLSLRIMNWCTYFFGHHCEQTMAHPVFARRLWLELRRMGAWLSRHLETHLLANHLFENAAALALLGSCFEGNGVLGLRKLGLRMLHEQLDEQVLGDGGHYERSPMYHQRVLYVLGTLLDIGDRDLERMILPVVPRMLTWLEGMTHPDGSIARFNDAADGIYPTTETLRSWFQELGVSPVSSDMQPVSFERSGYHTARNEHGDYVVMDAGEIGPNYQPGHAHADFLAIESSFAGRRFVVDGGNKEYAEGKERDWARSVDAHSTVFVRGHEPLELWGSFRVGRRGRPIEIRSGFAEDGRFCVDAAHDGYQHLPGRPTPRRCLAWSERGIIYLKDGVDSSHQHDCVTQLRIDGRWKSLRVAEDCVQFSQDGVCVFVLASTTIAQSECRYFPNFGVRRSAHLLQCRFQTEQDTSWVIARADGIGDLRARLAEWHELDRGRSLL